MEKLELGKWVLETLKESKDIVLEQAPDVLQQYLAMQSLDYKIALVIGIVVLTLGFLYLIGAYIEAEEGPEDGVMFIAGIFIAFGFFTVALSSYKLYILTHYTKAYLLDKFL